MTLLRQQFTVCFISAPVCILIGLLMLYIWVVICKRIYGNRQGNSQLYKTLD